MAINVRSSLDMVLQAKGGREGKEKGMQDHLHSLELPRQVTYVFSAAHLAHSAWGPVAGADAPDPITAEISLTAPQNPTTEDPLLN